MDDNEYITISSVLGSDLLDYGNLTISTSGPVWTVNPGYITSGNWSTTNSVAVNPSARMELVGQDADIVINGDSISDAIRAIETRLNILRPNPALEAQWDQLRDLGEQYRRLEAELLEKQEMWDTLKKMPPSDKT